MPLKEVRPLQRLKLKRTGETMMMLGKSSMKRRFNCIRNGCLVDVNEQCEVELLNWNR